MPKQAPSTRPTCRKGLDIPSHTTRTAPPRGEPPTIPQTKPTPPPGKLTTPVRGGWGGIYCLPSSPARASRHPDKTAMMDMTKFYFSLFAFLSDAASSVLLCLLGMGGGGIRWRVILFLSFYLRLGVFVGFIFSFLFSRGWFLLGWELFGDFGGLIFLSWVCFLLGYGGLTSSLLPTLGFLGWLGLLRLRWMGWVGLDWV